MLDSTRLTAIELCTLYTVKPIILTPLISAFSLVSITDLLVNDAISNIRCPLFSQSHQGCKIREIKGTQKMSFTVVSIGLCIDTLNYIMRTTYALIVSYSLLSNVDMICIVLQEVATSHTSLVGLQ